MRKLLTAGIFGTILSLTGANYAGASIISRGFFDEAMENYATNTALDLKANQSDLVNLSNIVGTPKELKYGNIILSPYIRSIMGNVYFDTYADNTVPTNDISELINLNYTDTNFPGLAGVVQSLFERRNSGDQWPIRLYEIFDDYELLHNEGHSSFTNLIFDGGALSNNDIFYGLPELTTMIGTLPSGNFPDFPEYEDFFSSLRQPLTYPTSLKELITAIYGNYETFTRGLLDGIISGFRYDSDGDGSPDAPIGLIPNFMLANANATKIGDLPTEYATVGAALTAMDAKITAKNLPSTSDDGQYVLTAKKVGETVTYTWVKMDLTNEEQIQ